MADETRRVIITIKGSDADFRIALGIIFRQLLRGQTTGEDPTRWEYRVETPPAD
jgi:hypothetical protein